jgi:mycothiol synthase
MRVAITERPSLTRGAVQEVLALGDAAAAADAVPPLSEQVLLRLDARSATVRHVTLDNGTGMIGYGQFSAPTGAAARDTPPTAELVVHPDYRRRSLGRALAVRLADLDPTGTLRIWAPGDHPGSRALADRLGYRPVRELLQLGRSLDGPHPAPALPADVKLRTFRPGPDEEAWLAANSRAFARHPEQGRMTAADLRQRMAEPWFDPEGFLLAERDGAIVGFNWTKVHPAEPGGRPVGEIYALGVRPHHQRQGLGRALARAGLRSLAERGIAEVVLFVEGDSPGAVALYADLGFTRRRTDLMYQRPARLLLA